MHFCRIDFIGLVMCDSWRRMKKRRKHTVVWQMVWRHNLVCVLNHGLVGPKWGELLSYLFPSWSWFLCVWPIRFSGPRSDGTVTLLNRLPADTCLWSIYWMLMDSTRIRSSTLRNRTTLGLMKRSVEKSGHIPSWTFYTLYVHKILQL